MGNEPVGKDVCNIKMDNMQKEIDVNVKRLDSHSGEIKELTTISAKLTQLVELQSKQLENLTEEVKELKAAPKQDATKDKSKWYESDIGKFLIKAGVVAVFVLIGAAVGINAVDKLQPLLGK